MSLTKITLRDGNVVQEAFPDFDEVCEVCVIGLGTAGAVAAIAAAEQGADVIGIDAETIPGGTAAAACVWDYYYGANGGIYERINREAQKILDEGLIYRSEKNDKISYPTIAKSLAIRREFERVGVRARYSCVVTAVVCERDTVRGVVIFDGEREYAVGAAVVIDAAEGAVCRLLGLPTHGGRRSDGKSARFSRTVARMEGTALLGSWTFCGDFANLSPEEASKSALEWSALPPCLPETLNENSRLYALGSMIGRREVPCVVCEENVDFAAYLDGERTDRAIFYSFSPLDNANADKWNEDEELQDWQVLCDLHGSGISVGIPPEALIPKGIGGLLLAGKHIGTGHSMTATVRMKTDMEKCGEAAGVLAALAAKHGGTLAAARGHFDELRAILAASGCYDPKNNRGFCDLNVVDGKMWKPVPLPGTADELREALASDYPAVGLFAVRSGAIENIADTLALWTGSDEQLLSENAAVALGLLGDRRAIPRLREILRGDVVVHTYQSPVRIPRLSWLWQTKLCNFIKAILLLGRFGDRTSLEVLKAIEASADEMEIIGANPDAYRVQLRGYASAAIDRIRNS